MSPLECFDYIFFVHINRLARVCCIDLFHPKFKPWSGTYLYFTNMVMALLCSLYVLCTYDMETGLNTITSWGTSIQGMVKYATVVIKIDEIRNVLADIRQIFVQNESKATKSNAILQKWGGRFVWMIKAFTIMIFTMCFLFILYPLPVYLFSGTRVAIFPIYLPFVDENTTVGYSVQTSFQVVLFVQAAFGLTGSDAILAMQMLHILPMAEVFENNFEILNKELTKSSKSMRNLKDTEKWIANLVKMHQDISRFLKDMSRIYYVVFFCDVYSNGLTLCFVIFCLMVQTWIPLYILFAVFLFKLFIICFLGTIVETCTDRVLQAIHSSKWYLLPLRLQHHIMLMMAQAQSPTIMQAGTAPLNLDTFVNVMKNVYSVAMILSESIK